MSDSKERIKALQQQLSEMRASMEAALANKNETLLDQIITKSLESNSNSAVDDDFYNEIEKHAIDLETDHPKAASLVREVMSTLNSLGI